MVRRSLEPQGKNLGGNYNVYRARIGRGFERVVHAFPNKTLAISLRELMSTKPLNADCPKNTLHGLC
jgi:hypothetical protein